MIVDAAFLADPYPAYAALREAGPLHRSEAFAGGAWLLPRHADVDAVLRDTARFSARRTGGWVRRASGSRAEAAGFQRLFARAMLFLDAPEHPRLRAAVAAGFGAAALRDAAPRIARRVESLLDAVDGRAGFDAVAALARPLPAATMAMLMGVPAADEAAFVAASDDLAAFIGEPRPTASQQRAAQAALLALRSCFEGIVARRGGAPGDDLVGTLLRAEAEGRLHSRAELLAQCAMLLFAGHETTRHLIAVGLRALLAEPARWQRLAGDPALLPHAVRELLRHDSPVQYTGRRVAADTLLHGRRLRRGELVIALVGSANRDPARWPRPDALELDRRAGPGLAFGAGPHACLGAALTLLEAETAFAALLRRFPHLRLDPGGGGGGGGRGDMLFRAPAPLPAPAPGPRRRRRGGVARQPALPRPAPPSRGHRMTLPLRPLNLHELRRMHAQGEKLAMLTCYDASFARVLDAAGVDLMLVGDSLGMVLQGREDTLAVSLQEVAYHTACVARARRRAWLVADLPFGTYQASPEQALRSAATLMQAGAQMVKLEGGGWTTGIVRRLAARGIPVCGHLGLTPQSVHALGGWRVQGRSEDGAATLRRQARELVEAGAAMLVLELVPALLARRLQAELPVPLIGIGAGAGCAGQVLVLHDLLGLTPPPRPRFVHDFLAEGGGIEAAVARYVQAVKAGRFPDDRLHAH